MAHKSTAPKTTTGERALNAALDAGFTVIHHCAERAAGMYRHTVQHSDGRGIWLYRELGTGRFVKAQSYETTCAAASWTVNACTVRSVPALERLLTKHR